MRASRLSGCLASATALLGCVPGTLAYEDNVWAGFRQAIGRVFHTGAQNIAPREKHSDPPYGYQPPPLTEDTSSSSASPTSTWGEYGPPPSTIVLSTTETSQTSVGYDTSSSAAYGTSIAANGGGYSYSSSSVSETSTASAPQTSESTTPIWETSSVDPVIGSTSTTSTASDNVTISISTIYVTKTHGLYAKRNINGAVSTIQLYPCVFDWLPRYRYLMGSIRNRNFIPHGRFVAFSQTFECSVSPFELQFGSRWHRNSDRISWKVFSFASLPLVQREQLGLPNNRWCYGANELSHEFQLSTLPLSQRDKCIIHCWIIPWLMDGDIYTSELRLPRHRTCPQHPNQQRTVSPVEFQYFRVSCWKRHRESRCLIRPGHWVSQPIFCPVKLGAIPILDLERHHVEGPDWSTFGNCHLVN
ncbi:hypothetical protein C8A00DRAFT_32333 [Chaetomidium leptoderma]|uniref:Uncharacterized protein n=1 Tax=Chaetomidium leptoderma TaxID=669021 RepID=A0AAN6VNL7_9PEZI|nr:hypothetical protein C8A00DRAFT_32333 [Chaetomidium leptoderma]